MYYRTLRSIYDLVGEDGYLRLPPYTIKEYILDDERKIALGKALNTINSNGNVLIVGPPGSGKTAFMAYLVSKLMEQGTNVGIILEGATIISNEHEEEGVVLIYDDLPRMNMNALKSIVKNNVKKIIATARSEELTWIWRVIGVDITKNFTQVTLSGLSNEHLRQMLYRYAEREAIKIQDPEAVDIVIGKAEGLPVYIWQVIRELKLQKKSLTKDFANNVPQGMLDYIDDILWRILDEHPERYEILLTLLVMSDLRKYAIHQDVFNFVYLEAKEVRTGKKYKLEDALFSDLLDRITRYLAREAMTYSFRLSHDSWGDVLKGKSNGPMSGEISRINTVYPKPKRAEILKRACLRAWKEALEPSEDLQRIETFRYFLKINEISIETEPKKVLEKTERPSTQKLTHIKQPQGKESVTKVVQAFQPKVTKKPKEDNILSKIKEMDNLSPEDLKSLELAKAIIEEYFRTGNKFVLKRLLPLLQKVSHPVAHYNLGVAYYELGDIKNAYKEMKKTLKRKYRKTIIKPEPHNLIYLAILELRKGNYAQAINYLNEYLQLEPHKTAELDVLQTNIFTFSEVLANSKGFFGLLKQIFKPKHSENVNKTQRQNAVKE